MPKKNVWDKEEFCVRDFKLLSGEYVYEVGDYCKPSGRNCLPIFENGSYSNRRMACNPVDCRRSNNYITLYELINKLSRLNKEQGAYWVITVPYAVSQVCERIKPPIQQLSLIGKDSIRSSSFRLTKNTSDNSIKEVDFTGRPEDVEFILKYKNSYVKTHIIGSAHNHPRQKIPVPSAKDRESNWGPLSMIVGREKFRVFNTKNWDIIIEEPNTIEKTDNNKILDKIYEYIMNINV